MMGHKALYLLVLVYLSGFTSYYSASLHSALAPLASSLVVEPANLAASWAFPACPLPGMLSFGKLHGWLHHLLKPLLELHLCTFFFCQR